MDDEINIEPKVRAMVHEISNDLEDLREALISALQSYERNLNNAIGRIPVWTEVKEDDVYQLFEIPEIEDAILGPRAVAIVAQAIDEHVENWLGYPDDLVAKTFDDEDTKAYRKSCAEVESELLALSHNARRVTSEATKKLGEDLDSIMHRLDQEREHDENALKDLVVDGSVEKGDSARLEIADLWERYRSHAESLNVVWEELESLAFQGMDMVVAGIEDIRWIMRQSEDALTLLNPELNPEYEVASISIRDDETRTTFEISREPEEKPKDQDNDGRETIEIDREHEEKLKEEIEKSEAREEAEVEPEPIEPSLDLSEVSEVVGDEFWATRTIYVATPVPLLEVSLWAIPFLALSALAVFFGIDPDAVLALNIPNLPVIVGVVALYLIAFPILRKWILRPTPTRRTKQSEDLKIEIGDYVKVGNTKIDKSDFTLERWSDDDSTEFGWQLSDSEFILVGLETNLTRWQSVNHEIVDRDPTGWRMSKSQFRTLCKALSLSLS